MRLFVILSLCAFGCSDPTGRIQGGGPNGTNGNPNGNIDNNNGDTCTNMTLQPMKLGDPDILVIQDMSSSMNMGSPTRYSAVSNAMAAVINALSGQPIEWGLALFPTDGDCGVSGAIKVPVGASSGPQVVATLKATSPDGSTPLTAAVQLATSYYQGLSDGRAHYFVVSTDGEPNCDSGGGIPKQCSSNTDCPSGQTCQNVLPGFPGVCVDMAGNSAAEMALSAALQAGIRTYVVGIDASGGDAAALNNLAIAGGTARAGSTKYYPASDQNSLQSTFQQIAKQVVSCTFQVTTAPDPKAMIEVQVGGQQVARDPSHVSGWDFDPTSKTLTFYGGACDGLQTSTDSIQIGYTCPPPS